MGESDNKSLLCCQVGRSEEKASQRARQAATQEEEFLKLGCRRAVLLTQVGRPAWQWEQLVRGLEMGCELVGLTVRRSMWLRQRHQGGDGGQ